MEINIPYWGQELTINLPDENISKIVYPNKVEIRPEKEVLSDALICPVEYRSFDDFAKGNEPILFIINDAIRIHQVQ